MTLTADRVLARPARSPGRHRRIRGGPGARRPDIQGLRAIAVVLVIASHAGFAALGGGFIGVDVFFVISGFLITSLLLGEVERTGTVSIRDFYARRARRILPAATLVLVLVLGAADLTASTARLHTLVHDAGWSSIFLANVHFAAIGTNYFADQTPSPFQHFWSLAVEEQFYLVWPLVVLVLAPRIRRYRLALVMVAVAICSLVYSIRLTAAHPAAAYFSSPARAYELAAGAALAAVVSRGWRLQAPYDVPVGIAGLAAVLAAAVIISPNAAFPGWQALIPVLGTVAMLAAGTARQEGVSRLLGKQPLRYLGDISYSLYLWHWPILILGYQNLPRMLPHSLGQVWTGHLTHGEQRVILLAITVAVSAASYRWIEQPFQHRRVRLARGQLALALWPVALASVLVVATAGDVYAAHETREANASAAQWFAEHPSVPTTTITPDPDAATAAVKTVNRAIGAAVTLAREGAPIPPALNVAALPSNNWHSNFPCIATYGQRTTKVCAYGDPNAHTLVAVVGDSHSGMWLPALDALGKREHFKLVPVIKMGCSAYDVTQGFAQMPAAECSAFRAWSRTVVKKLHPDEIIATSRNELWMTATPGASIDQQWKTGVESGLKTLGKVAPVVVLSDVPQREDAAACLSKAHQQQDQCMTSTSAKGSSSDPLTEAAAKSAGARWVDVLPLVCHGSTCPAVVGNLPVYYDDSHLSLSWVTHVTGAFGELLPDPATHVRS